MEVWAGGCVSCLFCCDRQRHHTEACCAVLCFGRAPTLRNAAAIHGWRVWYMCACRAGSCLPVCIVQRTQLQGCLVWQQQLCVAACHTRNLLAECVTMVISVGESKAQCTSSSSVFVPGTPGPHQQFQVFRVIQLSLMLPAAESLAMLDPRRCGNTQPKLS